MSRQPSRSQPPPGRRSPAPDAVAPDGSEIRFLLDARRLARGASMVEVVLPPGQVSRPVYHRTVEELWYILEGTGQVWRCPPEIDPTQVAPTTVQPGDALTIPTGWLFQFSAASAAALRFLCVTLPPWPGPGGPAIRLRRAGRSDGLGSPVRPNLPGKRPKRYTNRR